MERSGLIIVTANGGISDRSRSDSAPAAFSWSRRRGYGGDKETKIVLKFGREEIETRGGAGAEWSAGSARGFLRGGSAPRLRVVFGARRLARRRFGRLARGGARIEGVDARARLS